jgi:hypothetical protein
VKPQRKVYTDTEATGRLDALGLSAEGLRAAIEWAYTRHVADVTEDEPRNSPGMTMYLKLTGQLRRTLAVFGWRRDDSRNQAKTVHPLGIISIVVAGGDDNTGRFGEGYADPCTVSQKGPTARRMVNNPRLFDVSELLGPRPTTGADGAFLYYLLVHVDKYLHEVRSELSQPLRVGRGGIVNEWAERISLPAIPFGDAEVVDVFDLPPTPIHEIDVQRRSAEG